MIQELCNAKIKIPKKLIDEGCTDDNCHNVAINYCEDCGAKFCHHHTDRTKHKCDDKIKGVHSVWKQKNQ